MRVPGQEVNWFNQLISGREKRSNVRGAKAG
jgi:hypothetical protein